MKLTTDLDQEVAALRTMMDTRPDWDAIQEEPLRALIVSLQRACNRGAALYRWLESEDEYDDAINWKMTAILTALRPLQQRHALALDELFGKFGRDERDTWRIADLVRSE